MPLYHFHLYDGGQWLFDAEGNEMPDVAAAVVMAVYQARDIIAADIRIGRLDFNQRITIDDAAGSPVHVLRFGDAVSLDAPRKCPVLDRSAAALA